MKEFDNIRQDATFGELYEPAMEIAKRGDVETASRYFQELVDLIQKDLVSHNREEAVSIAHSNLGYFAGYYSNEVRAQVKRVFGSSHPLFGDKIPTPKQAFDIGMAVGGMKGESMQDRAIVAAKILEDNDEKI